MDTDINKRC